MKIARRRLLQTGSAALALGAVPLRFARGATGPLKVGVMHPTSGILAASGQSSKRGTDLALAMLQASGGPAIELVYADTESKVENGRILAEKLIQNGCTVLIGAWDSGATIAAAQVCEQSKIPLMVNIASAPQVTEQGFTYLFRNFTPATSLVYNAVVSIKELQAVTGVTVKTAVLMHVNDTFGLGVKGGIDALWKKLDVPIEIVDTISYDPAAKDLSVEVSRAKATNADLVLPVTRVNDAVMLVREMVKQRYSPRGIIGPGSPGPYESAFTTATGKYGEDYMVCVPWYDPSRAQTKAALAEFAKRFPAERFELNVGFSYEAVMIVADAFKRAGSSDPAALHAALKTTDLDDHVMFGGPIRFDAKGQNTAIGGAMLQIQGGAPKVVAPTAIAEAKPIFPMKPWADR